MLPLRPLVAAALAAGLFGACGDRRSTSPPLMVYVAASLQNVASELGEAFAVETPVEMIFNVAGTNALAQQILATPGADVLLAADPEWVDTLERAGRVVADGRRTLFSNTLVLVAHPDGEPDSKPDRLEDLPAATFTHLAVADPEAVPAGRYARAALDSLTSPAGSMSVWDSIVDRVVPTGDVRAALALVEADPRVLGIVYRTDLAVARQAQPWLELPAVEGRPIRYVAAVLVDAPAGALADRFLAWLGSAEASDIAERHGFSPVGRHP